MTEPCDLTAVEARRLIGARKMSPVELLDSCIKRIEAVNPAINAVVAMDAERAREDAAEAEQMVMDGEMLGDLHGLPLGIKDLNPVEGLRSTWGSLLFEDHVPDEDDDMVAQLRLSEPVIFAKTNTPEFGAGANTTNRVYGPTGNPFDPSLTPAGSSGGSAAALATGMMPLATGSDYGGSLRTPAAFCGIAGYRPSPGMVPATGRPVSLNPFSVLGPMGRTIEDATLLLSAQMHVDPHDPFSGLGDVFSFSGLTAHCDLADKRVAFSADLGVAPIDDGIRRTFAERTKLFGHLFADAGDIDGPFEDDIHDCFEILRGVNFVAAHGERLKAHRDKLDRNVIDNTERGLKYSLADVAWAHQAQTRAHDAYVDLFDDFDVLICPAAAVSPFPHEQLFVEQINGETMPTYMRWLAITYALTMALPCAAVIPCGVDDRGLPFGLQVAGPNGSDDDVLNIAHALEQVFASDPVTARPVPDIARLSATGQSA